MYSRRGMGDTIAFPYSTECYPGMIDPTTGDTIASCGSGTPASSQVPTCAVNQRVSGTCVCPAGYSLDQALMCTANAPGSTTSPSLFGLSTQQLMIWGVVLIGGMALIKAAGK